MNERCLGSDFKRTFELGERQLGVKMAVTVDASLLYVSTQPGLFAYTAIN
jgi:hypothetical protein